MLSHDVLEERDDDAEELVGVRQEIAPNKAPGWPPATPRLPENQLAREDVGHAAVAAEYAKPRALPRAQVKVEGKKVKLAWRTYCS